MGGCKGVAVVNEPVKVVWYFSFRSRKDSEVGNTGIERVGRRAQPARIT
jgi:hypothetical protein